MVFSSIFFLSIFLPVFLLVFYLSPVSIRKWVIILFSIFFYAWGAPVFILFLLASSIIDFTISKFIQEKGKRQKKFLLFSLILNIGLLFYFKYANFFMENYSLLRTNLGFDEISFREVLLPIGISFFTFQKISYALDIYYGSKKRMSSFRDYLLYIIMFPQLIAGPIVRFKDVADQIRDFNKNKFDQKLAGMYRFVQGLAMKVLLANNFALIVKKVNVQGLEAMTALDAWTGIFAYTFQIYFDFAGYSSMAIGLGLMMGFRFPENFNFPYLSKSITEFWKRWHMTLGSWMRDYLYIPLGGNRVTSLRLYFNLIIVFLLSGFWHGANWNFIFWGLYHGFFLVIERLFLRSMLKKIPAIFQISYTFFVVIIGWVFFSMDYQEAIQYLAKMFGPDLFMQSAEISSRDFFVFLLGILFSFYTFHPVVANKIKAWPENFIHIKGLNAYAVFLGVVIILALSVLSLFTSGFNPFIYYRF